MHRTCFAGLVNCTYMCMYVYMYLYVYIYMYTGMYVACPQCLVKYSHVLVHALVSLIRRRYICEDIVNCVHCCSPEEHCVMYMYMYIEFLGRVTGCMGSIDLDTYIAWAL